MALPCSIWFSFWKPMIFINIRRYFSVVDWHMVGLKPDIWNSSSSLHCNALWELKNSRRWLEKASWRFFISKNLIFALLSSCCWVKFSDIENRYLRHQPEIAWQSKGPLASFPFSTYLFLEFLAHYHLTPFHFLRTPEVRSRNYWVSTITKQTEWPIELWTLKQEMETDEDHAAMRQIF